MPFFWPSRARPAPKGFHISHRFSKCGARLGSGGAGWGLRLLGMVGRPSVDGQPRPDPATGERDRQPKPVQLWGDGEGERGEVAANTFQKMSGKCLPGPRPNRLPMALNNISENWQQHFRTWVVLSFKKDNGGWNGKILDVVHNKRKLQTRKQFPFRKGSRGRIFGRVGRIKRRLSGR